MSTRGVWGKTGGEYPPDWKQISDATCAAVGHRCIRCGHPYRKGTHGKGQWTACDAGCRHKGPARILFGVTATRPVAWDSGPTNAGTFAAKGCLIEAEWRILTVHHFDGQKDNCAWWNLLALCQRCHLQIQGKVDPETPFFFEHTEWAKPYVAGFYAKKYEGRLITREEAEARMVELLAHELRAEAVTK